MAHRPTWHGHLKLSLVTCPVVLYTATNTGGDVHFHLINPKTNNRVRMVATDPDTGPVERSSLVRGFEVAKDEYVLLTDEEIRAVKLESTKTIDIETFVPAGEIDRLYWDEPYFLVPDGEIAQEAFGVIREALKLADKIALARIVLATRERILALEPHGAGIVAYSIRTADEVRNADDMFLSVSHAKPNSEMIAIAGKIIEQREGPFDPSRFDDRYEEALRALIEEKTRGHNSVVAEPPADTNVIDLMSALRSSLQGKPAPTPSRTGKTPTRKSGKAKRTSQRPA
jgi:DNA end-binding protein Ku